MNVLDRLHRRGVHARRIRVLGLEIIRLLPKKGIVVDVGCGDGLLTSLLRQSRPDLTCLGLDVLVRSGALVPTCQFDGRHLPLADSSVDSLLFVDVLHHAEDALTLLREARRVARGAVIIKDHFLDPFWAGPRLRFMDYVGNARHGVSLPYRYMNRRQWNAAFAEAGLKVEQLTGEFNLYPPPASWVFGGDLHFLAKLVPL